MRSIYRFNFFLLGLACFFITACSTVTIGYSNAPELTYQWLNRYINFNTVQQQAIREELKAIHIWHQEYELPRYIAILESLQKMATQDATNGQACEVANDTRERFRILSLQFEPVIERLSPTIRQEQLDHLRKKFEKRNREWHKQWLQGSQEERDAQRLKRTVKRAEMFYGRLNGEQKALLKEYIRTSAFNADISYAETLRRQEDALATLEKIMRKQLGEADRKMEVAAYFDRFLRGDDAAYQDYIDRVSADSCNGLARLHNSASPAQRERAARKLGSYLADLRTLRSQYLSTH
jgi:hypothetical protein